MKEYSEQRTRIDRIFTVEPNAALGEGLSGFERQPRPRSDQFLRTLAEKAIILTSDVDRGQDGAGEGAILKAYESRLLKLSPRGMRFGPDLRALDMEEGILLQMTLEPGITEEPIVNHAPMFNGSETILMHYFVPAQNLAEGGEVRAAGNALHRSLASGDARAIRPRVVAPDRRYWPDTFTKRERKPTDTPSL